MAGCSNDSETKGSGKDTTTQLTTIQDTSASLSKTVISNIDSLSDDCKIKPVSIEYVPNHEELGLTGFITIGPSSINSQERPLSLVEVMPEFHGGIDSLVNYIRKGLVYPEYEKTNRIEGTVYTSFIVGKNGEVRDARIFKSVEGSKNFDNEVLRIISNMPPWKPGVHHGDTVEVRYYLPVHFKL